MNDLISQDYLSLNQELHRDSAFGAGGHVHAPLVIQLCQDNGYSSVLDYGCGKGTLKKFLAKKAPNISVLEYDPAIVGKDQDPGEAELVVSLDVMEHIEPENIDQVLGHLCSKATRAVLAYVSLQEARRTLPDGRNAHLIIQPDSWWHDKLCEFIDPVFEKVTENETKYGLARHFLFIGRSRNRREATT